MSISERSQRTASAIFAALQVTPTEAQARSVAEIITQALVNTTLEAGESATHAVMTCCSPDLDIAHKVTAEIRRREQALVTNLSSLR